MLLVETIHRDEIGTEWHSAATGDTAILLIDYMVHVDDPAVVSQQTSQYQTASGYSQTLMIRTGVLSSAEIDAWK